jgi:predicted phosphoribosyltransferase
MLDAFEFCGHDTLHCRPAIGLNRAPPATRGALIRVKAFTGREAIDVGDDSRIRVMPFVNRSEAGRLLAEALAPYRNASPVVLALPRGGVPVAAEIALPWKAPLDLALVRKIGVPGQKELAMGAVVDGDSPTIVRNEDVIRAAGITEKEFQSVCSAELAEIERRRKRYLGGRKPASVAGRTVIVVDDGLATGATMRAALRAIRQRKPERIVLAVPVAPPDTLAELSAEADEVVCLETPAWFGSIGGFYDDFRQVSDEEVTAALDAAAEAASPTS